MSKEDTLQNTINQLKEENEKLKLQLEIRNTSTNTNHKSSSEKNKSDSISNTREFNKIENWNFHYQQKTFSCSDEIKQLLEIPKDQEFSNFDHLKRIIHPSEFTKFKELKHQLYFNTGIIEYTFHTILHDGSSRFINIKAKAKKDANGEILSVSGTANDVTELHFNSEKLRQNKNLFRSIFDKLTDIFIIFELVKDKDDNVVDYIYKEVNPAFEMNFNIKKREIINRKLSAQTQIFQQFHPILKITAQTEQPQHDRFFIQSLDGFHDILIYSPSKNHVATLWRDVTLMVQTESYLRESEEKYRQIFSLGLDGLFMIDLSSSKILEVNPSACKMIGTTKDELLGLSFTNLFNEPELFEETIKTNKSNNITGDFIKQNGSLIPVEGSLSYFNWGGHKVVIISVRDISLRIAAQKELTISEKRFKQLFDYSNDAILILNDHKIVNNNKEASQLFGTNEKGLINKTLWSISPTLQLNGNDSRLQIVEKIQEVIQGKQLQFNWQFIKNRNNIFYADVKLSPIFFDDQKVIQVIVRDVTPEKILEDELIKKENRWEKSLKISSIGIWDWNIITNDVYFSTEWKKIIGYKKDEIQNKFEEFEKRIHPDDIANVYNQIESYFSNKTHTYNVNFRLRSKNGSYKWINAKGEIYSFTIDGKAERFIGTHTDITKFIVEQQKFQITNQNYTNASKTLKMGYWELNLRNMILNGPKETFAIFGLNSNQATLKQIENQIHPEDKTSFISQFINNKTDEIISQTFRILVNTQVKYVISFSKSISDVKNRIEGYTGVFQDISLFKKQEIQLKDEQSLINSYIEKTQQIILISQDQDLVYKTNKFTELTGYDINELYKNEIPFYEIVSSEDKSKLHITFENITLHNRSKESINIRIRTKYNRTKWVEVFITLLKFKGRNAVLFILNDVTKQTINEIKLKDSEQSFINISLNSPIGIAKFDLTEKLTYINSKFAELTGINENQLKKSSIKQIFDAGDYLNIHKAIEKIKSGSLSLYQNELLLNSQIWIKLNIVPYLKIDILNHFIIYIENIDLVKKEIDLLTEDNFIHKSLLNNSNAGVGIFNQNGDLIIHNDNLLTNLNYDLPQNTNAKFNDFYINKENTPLVFENILNTNENTSFEHSINANKTIFFELKSLDLLTSKAVLLITKDISETKQRSLSLINQLQKFNTIFDQSPTGTALIDSNRNIVLCNKKYADILGYAPNELMKMKLDQLIKTENLPDLITKLSELFSGVTSSFSPLIQIANNKKEKRWISSKFTQFIDNFNEVSFAIQVIDDITQSKEIEYSSINNERLKTLNYIASNFAHVFNNLLMSIYGNSYLLKSNLNDDNLSVYADNLLKTLKMASEQTHKLLSFAEKSSKIKLLINIPELINEIVDENKFKANVQIKTFFDHKIENTLGDTSQLQRVIQIIIQNAKDAMPNGGELTIETKSVYFDNINNKNLSELAKGKYLRISITDNGKGIHSDNITKIFDPFFSTKNENIHAGLGLTIAQKIIREHNGTIKVESRLNKGSDFMIYLPQFDDAYIHQSIQPDEQLIVKGTANLMIIDDEDIVRIVTAELLKKLGYNVFSFSRGKKAIQFYKGNMQNIDLVVLDKNMPEMDGIEVYHKLKKINPNINVILMTGLNIDTNIESVFNNLNSCIVQKPVSIENLSNAISNLLVKNNR